MQEEVQVRGRRKTKKGVVVSNKMQKTAVVEVQSTFRHPKYQKVVRRKKRYYAHVENTPVVVGDEVVIVETRPISKLKRWRVVES